MVDKSLEERLHGEPRHEINTCTVKCLIKGSQF
jgi:hypothetical protein